MSNRSWYTNDIDEIQVKNGDVPPEGFHRGRKPVSEETRIKMGKSQKGHPIYRKTTNKGMKYSDQARKNMANAKHKFLETHPKWTSPTSFVKGQETWNKGIPMREESRKKLSESRTGQHLSDEMRKQKSIHEHQTKKKNNSFNISRPEDRTYEKLISKFKKEDVIRQYRDENRYPFNCDFYVKSMDLFIECNFSWTHGHHPFDESSIEDMKTLEEWKNKSADSKYYQLAIEVWTKRDVLKRQTMINNKLNYFVAYKEDDINDFLSRI